MWGLRSLLAVLCVCGAVGELGCGLLSSEGLVSSGGSSANGASVGGATGLDGGATSGGGVTGVGGRATSGGGVTGVGGRATGDGGVTSGGGATGDGGATSGGGATGGGGGVVTFGFIEGEILGQVRHYVVDAYATSQGAAEGYLILSGRQNSDSYQDMFFIAIPNLVGSRTNEIYWFGENGIYGGSADFEVTEAAPEVGDVMKGTFSGVLTRSGTDQMEPLTSGRFELPRIE